MGGGLTQRERERRGERWDGSGQCCSNCSQIVHKKRQNVHNFFFSLSLSQIAIAAYNYLKSIKTIQTRCYYQ